MKTPQAGEFRLAQAVFQIITQVAQRPFFVRAVALPFAARDVGDGGLSRSRACIQRLDMVGERRAVTATPHRVDERQSRQRLPLAPEIDLDQPCAPRVDRQAPDRQ